MRTTSAMPGATTSKRRRDGIRRGSSAGSAHRARLTAAEHRAKSPPTPRAAGSSLGLVVGPGSSGSAGSRLRRGHRLGDGGEGTGCGSGDGSGAGSGDGSGVGVTGGPAPGRRRLRRIDSRRAPASPLLALTQAREVAPQRPRASRPCGSAPSRPRASPRRLRLPPGGRLRQTLADREHPHGHVVRAGNCEVRTRPMPASRTVRANTCSR